MSEPEDPGDVVHDWRCPFGTLFGRMLIRERPPTIVEHNLVEFACSDCKRAVRSQDHQVFRVLHRFNIVGELIETVILRAGYDDQVFMGSEWSLADIKSELRL
jgi:hypothetical protein